jgi:transcriptional antiterminator RfaH
MIIPGSETVAGAASGGGEGSPIMSGLRCWYAVYTKPNAEYRVARLLQLKGLEVFLPEIPSWKPRRGHRTEPLFPSYVFVRADWSAVPLTTVEWTPGVRRLVAFDGRPAVVPESAIALIRRRLAEGAWARAPFRPGERVRIVEGPLQGLEAVFEGPMEPAARVRVLLEFLGRVHRAVVPVAALAPAAPPAPRPRPPRRTRGRKRWIRGWRPEERRDPPPRDDPNG